ncbi:sporulation-specific 71 family protein [Aspergillus lucknowensis]|uniref:Pleckstrin homology domain-containing protein n=1 Tax=Aspergillus lucknowensis TaxID=176173 RepID=A0ABR4L9Y5_9EURO
MPTQHVGEAWMEPDSRTPDNGQPGLEPGSYTAEKLRHASADHIHITNKRFFIGPIPKNWLQSHRKSWYRERLNLRNYRSRAITFSTEADVAHARESSLTANLPIAPEEGEQDTEQEPDSSDQEASQNPQHLHALSQPYEEEQEPPSPARIATGLSILNEDNRDGVSTTAKQDTRSAYFTAREWMPTGSDADNAVSERNRPQAEYGKAAMENGQPLTIPSRDYNGQSCPSAPPSETESTVPLLRHTPGKDKGKQHGVPAPSLQRQEPQHAVSIDGEDEPRHNRWSRHDPKSAFRKITTRFSLDDNLHNKQQQITSKISKTQSMIPEWLSRRKIEEGEVIKAEKMLVRVEETMQDDLPEDYSEFDSLRMETRVQDNWREFLVVCRLTSNKEAPFTLQMHKTRVIPKIQEPNRQTSPYLEIPLGRKAARMNLYSSLDKTIAIWNRSKGRTNIYIMRPRSTARAVEWYTFVAHALGRRRASSLAISVPDLAVSLIFNDPFRQLEAAGRQGPKGKDPISASAMVGQSAYLSIIQGCMKMLESHSEWSEVMKKWSNSENMGLAWKRYDRLEWVYGSNEKEMYGSVAMQGTHELELRPKQHYDTSVGLGDKKEEEPTPVEGFLIRLTSQKGVHQRMNRMFSKRLYFFCQDYYLFFCKPSQALPPTPPRLCEQSSSIPSTQEIIQQTPLSYEVDPFPVRNSEIVWLTTGNANHLKQHDEDAYAEQHRNLHNLTNAEGFINLCLVQEVRHIQGGSPAAPNPQRGGNIGAGVSETNNPNHDEAVEQSEDMGFEMLLQNGLVVRFQAYNRLTRDEWMKRLEALVRYWKARIAADAVELRDTRQRNLEILGIDEESESVIGQFAKKWEVKKAEASPLLHHMCSLLACRPIKMSGLLYKKPRRHATFKRFHVMLTAGKLLIYHSSLRKRSGSEVPHIHHNIESTIELDNCYIYSGLLTDNDLLYANQTFDSNHPGHGALPRVYLTPELYTSSDEDNAITFVIWQPLRKNLFRARQVGEGQARQALKLVSKLGVHGRTIVFKARSRVEKDRWVLSIASEIDRLQEGKPEDIRLTSP